VTQFDLNGSALEGDDLLSPEDAVRDGMGVSADSPDASGVDPDSDSPSGHEDSGQPSPEQRVPYDRFAKVTSENKRLREELEGLRRTRESTELTELMAALETKAEAGTTSVTKAQLDMLRRFAITEHIQTRMPDLTSGQARLVASVLSEVGSKSFTVEDAVAVAARREPTLFARRGEERRDADEGPSPGSFSSQRPGPSGSRAGSIDKEIEKAMQALESGANRAYDRVRIQAQINRLMDEKSAQSASRRR